MLASNQVVDWQGTLDFNRLREARLSRARSEMEKHDLGAILTMDGWNTKYVTGTYTPQWTIGYSGVRYALLPRDGRPVLFEQGDIAALTRQYSPWMSPDDIRPSMTAGGYVSLAAGATAHKENLRRLGKQISDELAARGLAGERLGVDVGDIGVIGALTDAGLKPTPDGAVAMLNARKIKSVDEVECIRMATRIGEAMFAELQGGLRPGVSERELLADMIHRAYSLGAEVYNGVIIESGPTTAPNLRHTAGRLIGPGDIVYADVYNTNWNGYTTCYYRTFSLGDPKKSTVKAYDRALSWLVDGIDACRAGNTTRDIADRFPSAQEAWGYEDEHHATANLWGHGVGMALYEPPLVWRGVSMDHPLMLEEGMVVAIETQDYDGEGQGVRIEEVVRITADGPPEVLTRWPIAEISVVAI
jgi:Xaa-Pro aminopeptidase